MVSYSNITNPSLYICGSLSAAPPPPSSSTTIAPCRLSPSRSPFHDQFHLQRRRCCKAKSTFSDEGSTPAPTCSKKRPTFFPLEMLGNVSAASFSYLPSELHLDSVDPVGATLAPSSLSLGGGGSSWAASPQSVTRSSCGHALVLPARFRDAALIDLLKPASTEIGGNLMYFVLRSSVMSMDSMLPSKEELAEFPAAQNRRYSITEEFGKGDIMRAKC